MPISNPSSVTERVVSSYTGDGSTSRQITCGFLPSFVMVKGKRGATAGIWLAYMNSSTQMSLWCTGATIGDEAANSIAQHATDGFVVGVGNADFANVNSETYYYTAYP